MMAILIILATITYDVKPDDDDDDDVDYNDESPISKTLNLSHFVFDGIE